jgi:dihydroorotate dehydrogenase electron transfer subunit
LSHTTTQKGIFTATVLSNRKIGECFWRMDLEFIGDGARAFARFQPGQFLQIDVSQVGLPPEERIPPHLRDACKRNVILRRPFSFADVTPEAGRTTAELLYCVLGPASVRLTTLATGDSASILGPLGNGFSMPRNKNLALLVAGGMGLPPIRCLAKYLPIEYPQLEAIAFVGAKSVEALPFEGDLGEIPSEVGPFIPTFAKLGISSAVATDDGSAGYWGFITNRLTRWLDEQKDWSPAGTVIYACGPEPMLAAVARVAQERRIDCQVSMERRMACGVGLCQSCAVECKIVGSQETVYKLCCQDGPVFDARTVVFDDSR